MQIKVLHYHFAIGAPFKEGHPLTPAEAYALNNLRAENIRNATRHLIHNWLAQNPQPDNLLPVEQLNIISNLVRAMDIGYSFKVRYKLDTLGETPTASKPSKQKPGSYAYELTSVATSRIEEYCNENGIELTPAQWSEALKRFSAETEVQEMAKANLAARLEGNKKSLEELL